MSKTLPQQFVTQFDSEVKQAFQSFEESLRPSVRVVSVRGSTVRFQKIGKGLATQRVHQADVTPMNVAHSNVSATMVDFTATEFTELFDQEKINFDERQPLVMTIAGAMSRRLDQITLDAWDAASTTLTVAKTVGTTDAAGMPGDVFDHVGRQAGGPGHLLEDAPHAIHIERFTNTPAFADRAEQLQLSGVRKDAPKSVVPCTGNSAPDFGHARVGVRFRRPHPRWGRHRTLHQAMVSFVT